MVRVNASGTSLDPNQTDYEPVTVTADESWPPEWEEKLGKLPAWFTCRMFQDHWNFGLLTVTNHLFYVTHIVDIITAEDGEIWLDVELGEGNPMFKPFPGAQFVSAPTSRTKATMKASHIVAAFELCDT